MERKFLDLSAAHLTPDDMRELARLHQRDEWDSLLIGVTGVFLWTGYDESEFCPDNLKQVLKLISELYPDVDYVMFDADAEIHPDFPNFLDHWE